MTVRMLITCCFGTYLKGTLDAIKEETEYDYFIVGTDMNDNCINDNGIEKFYKVPSCEDFSYMESIKNICLKEKVNLVIPTHTSEQVEFSKNIKWFDNNNIKVLVFRDKETLKILNNKKKLSENFNEVNKSFFIKNIFHLFIFTFLRFCIKETENCGARGFKRLCFADFIKNVKVIRKKECIAQKYLSGSEYTVDCLCSEGIVLYSVVKHNEKMNEGVALKSVVVKNSDVENICKNICRKTLYTGPIGFDVKCNSKGEPFVIDVNPRFTATISLCNYAGVNIPKLAIRQLYGLKTEKCNIEYGSTIERKLCDFFYKQGGQLWKN